MTTRWLTIAEVQVALSVKKSLAYQLARDDKWRRKPVQGVTQYLLEDVQRTYDRRKKTRQ